jgi:glycosyltransferase involved in cell wall biosynthesis
MYPDAEVIIPVRNGADLLDECLRTLRRDAGDVRVTVVDDASDDATEAVARRHGAAVIRQDVASGPYAARNEGWRASEAQVIVFTDVRCRPYEGWFASLLGAVQQEGTVVAGSDVEMREGSGTVAQRWAVKAQPLRIWGYVEHPFLPYVPTASMAIRRASLDALGGFSPVRSGADADLCWRAQLHGMGRVAVSEVGMWAVPRDSSRAALRQFSRYGRSGRELQRLYLTHGHPPGLPRRVGTARRALGALWERRADPAVAVLDALRIITYERSFREQARQDLASRAG